MSLSHCHPPPPLAGPSPWALNLHAHSAFPFPFFCLALQQQLLSQRALALSNASFLFWFDETMNSSVIQDPLFLIMFALLISLWPRVSIEFGMPLTARTLAASKICVFLHEVGLACATSHPAT